MYRLASHVLTRLSCVAVSERCSSLKTGIVTELGSFCSTTWDCQRLRQAIFASTRCDVCHALPVTENTMAPSREGRCFSHSGIDFKFPSLFTASSERGCSVLEDLLPT